MTAGPTWGLVATIKASRRAILDFAAHHLDLGAHRLFIYLDDDNRAAFDALKAHPKCRPLLTDDAYWRKLGMKRRVKHQSRQFENARHAYARATGEVDWLAHIDVDEFLWPDRPLTDQLAALPATCMGARIRPAEALEGAGPLTHFKTCAPDRPTRSAQVSTRRRAARVTSLGRYDPCCGYGAPAAVADPTARLVRSRGRAAANPRRPGGRRRGAAFRPQTWRTPRRPPGTAGARR
jgi:hypothetical protein